MSPTENIVPLGDAMGLSYRSIGGIVFLGCRCPYWSSMGARTSFLWPPSKECTATLPNARLLVILDCGHFAHLEKPDVFFPAVDLFLRGKWPEEAMVLNDPAPAG